MAATVKIQRQTEYGYDEVEGITPAVVSVVEKINEPRFPSFKGIMAAKKKPIEAVAPPTPASMPLRSALGAAAAGRRVRRPAAEGRRRQGRGRR